VFNRSPPIFDSTVAGVLVSSQTRQIDGARRRRLDRGVRICLPPRRRHLRRGCATGEAPGPAAVACSPLWSGAAARWRACRVVRWVIRLRRCWLPDKPGGMGFFDDVPAAGPEPPRAHHPWELPEAEFPGVVPAGPLLLGRAERAAVAVTAMSAYATGFEIFVTTRIRPGGRSGSGCVCPTAARSSVTTAAAGQITIPSRPGRSWCGTPSAAARGFSSGGGGRGPCRRPGRWSSSASGPRSGSPRPGPASTRR